MQYLEKRNCEMSPKSTRIKTKVRTKRFLIKEVARRQQFIEADVKLIVNEVFEVMKDIIANGEELAIRNFFRMYTTSVKGYVGVNPKKNERIDVPPAKRVTMKSSKILHDIVNGFRGWGVEDDEEEEMGEEEE